MSTSLGLRIDPQNYLDVAANFTLVDFVKREFDSRLRSEAEILWKHASAIPAVLALATDKAVHPWLAPKRLEKSQPLRESSVGAQTHLFQERLTLNWQTPGLHAVVASRLLNRAINLGNGQLYLAPSVKLKRTKSTL